MIFSILRRLRTAIPTQGSVRTRVFVVTSFCRDVRTLVLGLNLTGDGQRDATVRQLRGET
jgi:hypothetical protein